uniref:Lipin/Ned1/Smp2 (LNS2) domain-containing protein n=1 Tax=Pyramimonas obovata TaxID=1411642 RepID=A0A7S0WY06_9CHLO
MDVPYSTLQTIRNLFPDFWSPFYAGFGNRETDERSYRAVGVPEGKIFTINPASEVVCGCNKMSKVYTLSGINLLLDQMFPSLAKGQDLLEQEGYNSWNYWKMDLPEIDDEDV